MPTAFDPMAAAMEAGPLAIPVTWIPHPGAANIPAVRILPERMEGFTAMGGVRVGDDVKRFRVRKTTVPDCAAGHGFQLGGYYYKVNHVADDDFHGLWWSCTATREPGQCFI